MSMLSCFAHAPRRHSVARRCLLALATAVTVGCSADRLVDVDPPTNTLNPAQLKSPNGAVLLYNAANTAMAAAFAGSVNNQQTYVALSGTFTDELRSASANVPSLADLRLLSPTNDPGNEGGNAFAPLQKARLAALLAAQAILQYGTASQRPLAGRMYALRGYSELLLAEGFCSGIPLSTIDFDGNFTYQPGSSTADVLAHALVMFDSAVTVSGDSTRFATLAKIGRGRALLDLGQYANASAAVAGISTAYTYQVEYGGGTAGPINYFGTTAGFYVFPIGNVVLGQSEGINGLPFQGYFSPLLPSPGDQIRIFGTGINKYANSASPVVLASGLEARLIEAEADLHAGGSTWLTTINALRTDGTQTTTCAAPATSPCAAPGSGGIAALPALPDPMTTDGRVNLVFQERGLWMFLTGHRLGDMRRLVRQYNRDPETVYPTGPYTAPNGAAGIAFGTAVVLPPDKDEIARNSQYTGCIDLHA